MFKITSGKGFHISFENGYTISIQFGYGNYCKNYNVENKTYSECENAEIAIWDEDGVWHTKDFTGNDDDNVLGYVQPEMVAKMIFKVSTAKRFEM